MEIINNIKPKKINLLNSSNNKDIEMMSQKINSTIENIDFEEYDVTNDRLLIL